MGARLRTAALFFLLTGIFVGFGWIIGTVFFGNWLSTVLLFLVFAGLMNGISYFFADRIVLWSYRARPVTEKDAPTLYRVVQRVAAMSNLPMPRVYIVPSAPPNALATGRNPKHAVVAVTEGALRVLNERELTAVIAHEMAHVRDRDILLMSVRRRSRVRSRSSPAGRSGARCSAAGGGAGRTTGSSSCSGSSGLSWYRSR